MTLDGIVDYTRLETMTFNNKAVTNEMTLNRTFARCNTKTNCTLHGHDVAGAYDYVLRKGRGSAHTSTWLCIKGRTRLSLRRRWREEIRSNVQSLLLLQNATTEYTGWDVLSEAIAQAAEGNATMLFSTLAISETLRRILAMQSAVKTGSTNPRASPTSRTKSTWLPPLHYTRMVSVRMQAS